MKQLFLIVISVIIIGCKSNNEISFCEGLTPEGNGITCGTIFSVGYLAVQITTKEPFGVDRLIFEVFEQNKNRLNKVSSITIKVKENSQSTSTRIHLYNEGKFIVKVLGNENKIIAEGEVEIIETY